VKCSYSETYPGTPLITEVRRDDDLDGDLDDDDANELQEIMDSEATENIGMVHVFSVISKVQEQLNLFVDRIKQRKEAEKDRKKFLEEEEERKKIEGIPVTVETFLAWKTKFDAEMRAKKKQKVVEDTASKRPTGKQQFLLDATLSLSDVKLMEEGDVAIDESLFQDIDDLELEDDDES